MSDFLNWELTNRMHNLGYDGKTLMYIDDEEDLINDDSAELIGAKPAILTSAAFRWFREKYKFFGCIDLQVCTPSHWFFRIDNIITNDYIFHSEDYQLIFKTYEEAELACLKKLIQIIKDETNKD